MSVEQRALEQPGQQCGKDAENGAPAWQPPYNTLQGGQAQFPVDSISAFFGEHLK